MNDLEITSTAVYIPNEKLEGQEMDAWRVTLTATEITTATAAKQPVRTMTTSYYMGIGHRVMAHNLGGHAPKNGVKTRQATWDETDRDPKARERYRRSQNPPWLYATPPETGEVLDSLASDTRCLDECRDEYDFMAEFGGELKTADDARKIAQTYHLIRANDAELRTLLGHFYQDVVFNGPEDGWTGDVVTLKEGQPVP